MLLLDSLVNNSLEWKLVDTITHNATDHTENLSVDLSKYKEVRIVVSYGASVYYNNFLPTSFIGDNAIKFNIGGGSAIGTYKGNCYCKLTKTTIIIYADSIMNNEQIIGGIFYLYVR